MDSNSYSMYINDPWLSYLLNKVKIIEGIMGNETWINIKKGDSICMFNNTSSGKFTVTRVTPYESIHSYLLQEGVDICLPGITNIDEAIDIYLEKNSVDEIMRYGFLGIGVELL